MDVVGAQKALYTIADGFKALAEALAEVPTGEEPTREEREVALMKEFDRPAGRGLTQQEASAACRRHGFEPQTVGAWSRGGWLVTDKAEDRRYLTDSGAAWLRERGYKVVNPTH